MNIGQRVFDLRKQVGLNQAEFGKRIGVTRSAICNYENGSRAIGEQTILSICREFNVNEAWLRTGQGDMFQPKTRSDEIEAFMKEILRDDSDFRQKFISVLARMTADEWKLLERKVLELAAEVTGGEGAAPARTDTDNDQEAKTAAAAEAAEVFDQVYLEKKAEAESSASPSDTGAAAGEKMA